MVANKIYIEGGGEGRDLDIRFREAWTKFFKSAGLSDRMPRPVRGKGRANTFDLFSTALRNSQVAEMPLLLLDSADSVTQGHSVWERLKVRDGWDKPDKATDGYAYLMVQVMETWLLADLDALRAYFGNDFKPTKIPAWTDLEAQSKQNILDALDKATVGCGAKRYAKGKISFEVLGRINPESVKQKCPHARRLLDFLTSGT